MTMRFAFLPLVWAAAAAAQVAEVQVAPAPPPPVSLKRAAAPVPQGMAADQGLEAPPPLYSIGQPTDEEQYYLELINRARAAPGAEGVRFDGTTDPDVRGAYDAFDVDLTMMKNEFNALAVRPPLAMNQNLTQAARAHSQDMFDHAFQGHNSTNGDNLGDRADDAGYNFSSLGENVFSYANSVFQGHAGFEVDWGDDVDGSVGGMQSHRGHRGNIHGTFREVGVGVVLGTKTIGNSTVGPQLVTQDFGTAQGSTPFVTGVAYYDVNGNSFYDPGEGIGGLTVSVAGASFQAVTANTGGYAVPVPATNTTRPVTFSGLGFNDGSNAVIAGLNNAKVDFAPAYAPPTVTGPANASTAGATAYTFTAVNGATGYEWRRATAAAAVTDTAANLNRVTVVKTGSYNELIAGAYHLTHVNPPAVQSIAYNAPFRVGNGASVNFQSKLRFAGTGEAARVQVSVNEGLSWDDVYVQRGTGAEAETVFNARSASLAAYAGLEIRLRFVYSFASGSFFPGDNNIGWFVDNIAFTNVTEIANVVTTAVPAGTAFDFTPPAVGDYVLAVRPVVTGGRALPYGPLLNVTGFNGPPPPAEVSLQQPAGTQLTDAVSTVNYGSVNVGTPAVRTFTVANVGGEALTGLAVNVDGANAGDFVAGALGAVTLNGGESTTFTVTFTPGAAGAHEAALHLTSNDGDESPFDVTLSGTGVAEPNITLQQPGGSGLTDGASTVSFGTTTLGVESRRTFTIVNDGNAELTGFGISAVGAHVGDFVLGVAGVANLAPGGSTTFDVAFIPTAAGARSATLRVASNDPDENPFEVTLSGTGDAKPVVSAPAPAAVMRQVGGAAVNFSVTAAPDPLTYQWKKNGANVTGATATTPSLTINAPKLTDGGAYTVLVKRGALSTTSAAAQLGVVENVPKTVVVAAGGSVTMKVNATGNGLTYLWKRQDATPLPEARLGGAAGKKTTTNTLILQKLDGATDSGAYLCEVTGPGGMVEGGTTTLRVFDEAPVIVSFDPPDGIVSGPYSYSPVMNMDADKTPTTFTMTGTPMVPPGLKIDSKTGVISGKPTKAGTYEIKLTVSNSKGKTPVTPATVVIAAFPDNLAGVYVGRVARSSLNGNAGGRIDLTVTATGTFTGSLTMGVTKYALTGALNVDMSGVELPSLEVDLKRAGNLAPLKLALEIGASVLTANSKVSADGQEAAIVGWRQVWHKTVNPATAYEGYYTTIFRLAGVVPEAPQGSGYGSFKVDKDGKLTVAGKTADGEKVTCAGVVGPTGQIVVFQALYTTAAKGSLLGQLEISLGGVPEDNAVSGALDWMRPAALPSARTFENGFGSPVPVGLTAVGGRYIYTAGSLILGLTAGTDNARLVFTGGGVDDSRRNPDVTFDVGANNKITMPAVGVENEAGAKLAVATGTGLFSGTFVLDDPDPRKPPPATPVILKRTVTYQGIMVRDGATLYGEGYFMLPEQPELGPPQTTPTTSNIFSGKVVLEEAP